MVAWNIHLHEWLIFMVNVGKYTSPMDPMGFGYIQLSWLNQLFLAPHRSYGRCSLSRHVQQLKTWHWNVSKSRSELASGVMSCEVTMFFFTAVI